MGIANENRLRLRLRSGARNRSGRRCDTGGDMIIDAGTTFEAGCTPDGACWTDFVSHRACEVRFMDKLPRNYKGFDFSSARGCVVWVLKHPAGKGWSNPKDRWTIEKVIAHEVGHDNCATVHRDGERWCRK